MRYDVMLLTPRRLAFTPTWPQPTTVERDLMPEPSLQDLTIKSEHVNTSDSISVRKAIDARIGSEVLPFAIYDMIPEGVAQVTSSRIVLTFGGDNGKSLTVQTYGLSESSLQGFSLTTTSGEMLMRLVAKRKGPDKYSLDYPSMNGVISGELLSAADIAFIMASGILSAYLSISSVLRNRASKNREEVESLQCDRLPDGTYQISHDLKCTFPSLEIDEVQILDGKSVITREGKVHMYVFCLFTVQELTINVLKCPEFK